MKKNLTFYALATMMLLGLSSVFCACSSDDDDNGNQQKAGDEAVAKLRNLVLDTNGDVIFGETETAGLYEIGFKDKEDATGVIANYLNKTNYSGENAEYQLPDNRGKVSVTGGQEEGVFYQVNFAVKGIPTITLLMEETNYMLGKENKWKSTTTYTCSNCKIEFTLPKKSEPKCTNCGTVQNQ